MIIITIIIFFLCLVVFFFTFEWNPAFQQVHMSLSDRSSNGRPTNPTYADSALLFSALTGRSRACLLACACYRYNEEELTYGCIRPPT